MITTTGEGNLAVLAFPKITEMEQFVSACLHEAVTIEEIVILRQRDFSIVARMVLKGKPGSVIYKKVIAPWHCEADVMLFLQNCKLPNTPTLIGLRKEAGSAQILQEDIGESGFLQRYSQQLALLSGITLAQTHDVASDVSSAPRVFPRLDNLERLQQCFENNSAKLAALFPQFSSNILAQLNEVGQQVARTLADGQFCLQHGDLYAENIVLKENTAPVFIDWSYFSMIGPRLYDLATLTSSHAKNGGLYELRQSIIEGYAIGSGVTATEIEAQLPAAYRLSRLLFLQWLLKRVEMGITETTVGPVLPLIEKVVGEIVN